MIADIITFVIAFGAAAALHRRRANPALMFLVSGASFILIGGLLTLLIHIAPERLGGITLTHEGADRTVHNTYYVVAHHHYLATMGLVPLVGTAMLGLFLHALIKRASGHQNAPPHA